MNKTVVLTDHAATRCAQRNLSMNDICYGVQHGKSDHRAGAKAYYLGERDIPTCDRRLQRSHQLVGLLVMVDESDDEIVVITVYRNREHGWKDHRSKSKHHRKRIVAA